MSILIISLQTMLNIRPLSSLISQQSPSSLSDLAWPENTLTITVLAPHPDDFDAIAVSLRFFQQRGDDIHLLVLSGGSKGVEDHYCGALDWSLKSKLREAEQNASCDLFGLSPRKRQFLNLKEAKDGELANNQENQFILQQALASKKTNVFILPYGEDTNSGHRRTFAMARSFFSSSGFKGLVLYNKDVKSTEFTPHVYIEFEAELADWKSKLLRCHDTQQQRNLNQRNIGFDQRILAFNQEIASRLKLTSGSYAEAFQCEFFF